MPIYLEYKYSQGYDDYQRNVTKWPSSGEHTQSEQKYIKFQFLPAWISVIFTSKALNRPKIRRNLQSNLVGHPLKRDVSCRPSNFHMGQYRDDSGNTLRIIRTPLNRFFEWKFLFSHFSEIFRIDSVCRNQASNCFHCLGHVALVRYVT